MGIPLTHDCYAELIMCKEVRLPNLALGKEDIQRITHHSENCVKFFQLAVKRGAMKQRLRGCRDLMNRTSYGAETAN